MSILIAEDNVAQRHYLREILEKEFLLQFGLKDLTELPSVEDFQDLAGGS